MFERFFKIIEGKPILSTIIFTIILSTIGTITYDYYQDWRDIAVPFVSISDIRISPESNSYFLNKDDLIPTSMELMEYLRDDIRASFVGLRKVLPYQRYHDYLKDSKKNILIFDAEKEYFLNSLEGILSILKLKSITENDKEKFFDSVWRNFGRIWASFDVLVSTNDLNLDEILKKELKQKKKHDNMFIFQKVEISCNSPKEKYFLRKKRGATEYLTTQKEADWDELRCSNEISFYKAIEAFDQKALITIFEKILERHKSGLLDDSLYKINNEIDQISRWEIDLIISNKGEEPFGVLPYAFLVVETKKPTKDYKTQKIPLEFRVGYNTLRTYLVSKNGSDRLTFLSKERIGENEEYKKWYTHFKSGNSQCKVELYTTISSNPIISKSVSFEASSVQ